MALYKCSVLDNKGMKKNFVQEAESKKQLGAILLEKGYTVISIEPNSSSKNITFYNLLSKVKSKDLAVFCRQMQAMLSAGVPVTNCLEIIKLQIDNKLFKIVIEDVYNELHKGRTFSEALRIHEDVFPEIFIHMVEAGEISGNLDKIMDKLSIHYEKEYKMQSKIKNAMAYPFILAIIALIVVIFLLTNVMPTFVQMYISSGVELPMITRIFINISNFIVQKWYILIGIIFTLIISIELLTKNNEYHIYVDKIKINFPIIKSINRNVVTSRFTSTLATLLGSGVSMLKALEIVSKVAGNKYIESKLHIVRDDVKNGVSLSAPLQKINVFPPMVHSMIKIGEDSGVLEEMLIKTAAFYDEEVENSIQRLTVILEPLMIVIMALIVGFIILAMVIPMFEMSSLVG